MIPQSRENDRLLCLDVRNESGVLAKVAGMLTRRWFPVKGISVGRGQSRDLLRLTIQVGGNDRRLEQICKQLQKIMETVAVAPYHPQHHIRRETALIRVNTAIADSAEFVNLAARWQGRILETSRQDCIFEITADPAEIDAFIEALDSKAIVEVTRSGVVAMTTRAEKMPTMEQLDKAKGGSK